LSSYSLLFSGKILFGKAQILFLRNKGAKICFYITEAMKLLYNSELYKMLEIEETKLWRLSPYALAQFLTQELDCGKITWIEEQ